MIGSRLGTFTNASGDVSYNERIARYSEMLGESLSQILGQGFGGAAEHIDSAILDMFFFPGMGGNATLPVRPGNAAAGGVSGYCRAVRSFCQCGPCHRVGGLRANGIRQRHDRRFGCYPLDLFGTGAGGSKSTTASTPANCYPNQPAPLPARDNITIEL